MNPRSKRAANTIRLITLACATVLWLAGPALALPGQDLLGREQASEESAAPETDQGAERFESPRAAFKFFLDEMRANRPQRVVESGVMDLSGLPSSERKQVGLERADRLYQILNRTEFIDVDALPGSDSGASSWTYRRKPPGQSREVVVRFDKSDEHGWRISADTIGLVGSLWEQFEGLPTIEEYRRSLPILDDLRETLRERLPEVLRRESFLLENWQWLGLAVLVLLAGIVDRVGRWILSVVLQRLAGKTRLEEDEVTRFERPAGLVLGALTFQVLLRVLGIKEDLRLFLDLAAGALATFAGVWAAYRLVDVVCGYIGERARKTDNRFDDMLVPLLRRTLKIFVTIVGLVYLASLMSEDLWGVVAGLSIGSLAVGFAARDSIENLFGTFTVLLDKPFQLGDWIVTDGIEGTVEEVGFRSTRIRTFYDSVISVPNRHFISTSVDNYGRRRYRRIKTMLSVTYDTPPEKIEAFCEAIREVVREHPYTRKDYYHVYLNDFAAASLDVLLYCFIESPDWGTELREKQRLYLDVLRVAQELGVSFAFPTQTIHMAKPEDMEHPDSPADDIEGTRRGREVGEQVARQALEPFGGKKPESVGYDEAYFAAQVGRAGGDE